MVLMKIEDSIEEQRTHKVTKSNYLIQNLRNKTGPLTLQEQRLILYLISRIKPEDTDFSQFELSCQDFCKICGITRAGINYEHIRQTIQKLADKSFWIEDEEGDNKIQDLVRWIAEARVTQRGRIALQIHPKLKPFLLHLKRYYTSYLLEYVLPMKSRYSVALYELVRSYANVRVYIFEIEELKRILGAETYTRWADLQRKVLEVAKREINSLSDLEISYKPIKSGRRYTDVEFAIRILDEEELAKHSALREKILNKSSSNN